MLVERLGINRYSLYVEFGSKQALFEAALQRYDKEVIGQTFGPLETAEASVKEVRALLEHFGSAGAGPAYGRGCQGARLTAVDPEQKLKMLAKFWWTNVGLYPMQISQCHLDIWFFAPI
jgi:AcrR family transcriptional regulator